MMNGWYTRRLSLLALIMGVVLTPLSLRAAEREADKRQLPPVTEQGATLQHTEAIKSQLPQTLLDRGAYHLDLGDIISVHIWGEYNYDSTQIISADGRIWLPVIGILSVVNLTIEKAETLLQQEVKKYYRNVKSGIIVHSVRSLDGVP